ncbi:MAG: Na+/H+ antiporter subunit E [Rickettsiales bacterium]|nr:Na+/H+ antiporter subunit E [Rickettsiales bacterium]
MLGLLILLAVSWLLWSGIYKPLLLGLGAFSCVLVLIVASRIGFFDKGVFSLHLGPRLPRYWIWLLKEIVISSLDVSRIVLSPSLPISPTVVKLKDTPDDPVGQAILGNAITLTPGTVTMDIVEGQMKVHCLTKDAAAAILAGEMSRRAHTLVGR